MSVQPCWSAWTDEECANFIAYTAFDGSVSQLRQDVLDLLASRRSPSPAVRALVEAAKNLRDAINESGNWCDSAIVENGCAWHIESTGSDMLDEATAAVNAAIAAVEKELNDSTN